MLSETHWIETQQLMGWGTVVAGEAHRHPKVVQVYVNWFWSANQGLFRDRRAESFQRY